MIQEPSTVYDISCPYESYELHRSMRPRVLSKVDVAKDKETSLTEEKIESYLYQKINNQQSNHN
jgi:hypothetical protein